MAARHKIAGVLALGGLALIGGTLAGRAGAQDLPMKVKGGHHLGETAEQFFGEGREKEMLGKCASGNLKSVDPDKRAAKKYCDEVGALHTQAVSGKRCAYQTGDANDMRTDTFTFDGGHLVKVELVYATPSAEYNYRGHTFEDILAGIKQAYGPPTSESTAPAQNVYGVKYIAHRELWLAPHAVVLINEQPGERGSTTLTAFTRAEYDRTMAAGAPKPANPLE
jgi:hypothetical protein